jgi:hypothetical protein
MLRKKTKWNHIICSIKTIKGTSWAWWYMPVMLALRMLRQDDHEFKARMGYIVSSRSPSTS